MFNYGIFRKTLVDSSPSIVAATVGLVCFVVLFMWSVLNMGTELMAFAAKFPFIKKMLEIGLGVRVDGEISVAILFAVGFTHLMVLMLAWSVIIATTTCVTVGENEKGTADLLLSLPVSRSAVYFSTSLVWIVAALILAFTPIIGIWVGTLVFEIPEEVFLSSYIAPACNFFCLNLAIGGLSSFAGCVVKRRGYAISFVAVVIFLSVVLNFIEPFVEVIGTEFLGMFSVKNLSLLTYYRPVDVVRLNEWPVQHMVTLVLIGVTSWMAGLFVYCRKDIPTA